MNLRKIDFQQKAIKRFSEKSIEFLAKRINDDKKTYKIIFRSPTGSGKTVMASKIIENIANCDYKVSFIWISVGFLPRQSKESFEKYIGGGGITFSTLDEILDNEIKENEILFTNWEKLNSKANKDNKSKDIKKGDRTNVFMRDNEWDRNLKTFCKNTRNTGRKIVLVVDESHKNITKNTMEIIDEIIKPHLSIDITATPKERNYDWGRDDGSYITNEEVKEAQMIKKEIVINANLTKQYLETSEEDGDTIVFDKAIEKMKELVNCYKKENSKVRPLILIQLPNQAKKLSITDKGKIEWVEKRLKSKYKVDYKNGKLAKWLQGNNKINLENIKKFDSKVQFLIFKQAIAVGWDCPRAQILIKFRETKSSTFEIQTVGRIMRSPEFKYYNSGSLNRAYVYANILSINIEKNSLEYIKTNLSKRALKYNDINLSSVYITRGEYNDLKREYKKYYYKAFFKKINGKNRLGNSKFNISKLEKYINLKDQKITDRILVNETITNIDNEKNKLSKTAHTNSGDDLIGQKFNEFLKKNTGKYQQARSFERIKTAIYEIFEKYLEYRMDDLERKLYYQKIVLKHKDFFAEIMEDSISKYTSDRKETQSSIESKSDWNIPKEDFYPQNYVKLQSENKCIMKPCYYSDNWKTEVNFIKNYLEENKEIDWWYKNGDSKNKVYLGILYEENNKDRTFYPDFIVQYKDGKIGVFDTKKGKTAKSNETRLKANALSKYIEKQNAKGKNLFGGIVIPKDNKYKNFKLNENRNHNYIDDQNGDWNQL